MRNFFAKDSVLSAIYFAMEKFGIWDERAFCRSCSTRQLARWLAYWRYKAAVEEAEIEKAKMRAKHG
jgi:hypothetical protein